MAVIETFPSLDIIAGFKGVLDFYTYKDTKCVRRWPVVTGHHSTRRESSNQARFTYFMKSLRAWDNRVKQLWRGTAGLANWRYHECAYRWYMGKGLSNLLSHPNWIWPKYKQWPPYNNMMWFIHEAHWLFREPYLSLVFWLDRPVQCTTLIWSRTPPATKEVIRVERGVKKSCGDEPIRWHHPHYVPMDSSFWQESPIVTHHLPWPAPWIDDKRPLWCQLVGKRGLDVGSTAWMDTDEDYSTGPVFRVERMTVPAKCRDGQFWHRGLAPANTSYDTYMQREWSIYQSQYRSWRWPYVHEYIRSDIDIYTPFPLEQFPPVGTLPT